MSFADLPAPPYYVVTFASQRTDGDNGYVDMADAMAALAAADSVGLDPADYQVQDLTDTFAAVDATTKQRQLMQFEIEMSAATLTFVQDTVRGRIDPNRIAEYYDFKRKDVNLEGALMVASASSNIQAYLDSRSPSNEQFLALKAELAKLKAEAGAEVARIEIAPGTLLKPGMTSDQLPNIIAAIRQRAPQPGLRQRNDKIGRWARRLSRKLNIGRARKIEYWLDRSWDY